MGKLNFKPRTIFCRDNLDVLRGINSACIDLIYLDPPFNKKKVFTAAAGSSAEGAEFSDIFRAEDVKDEWAESIEYENAELHAYLAGVKTFGNKYNYCYLAYMAIRLIECRRVLKDTGSIYLHCDPTMSHYLKIVLDCIFGEGNFRNEIVWGYPPGGKGPKFAFHKKHDIILLYGKTGGGVFNRPYLPLSEAQARGFSRTEDGSGRKYKQYPGGVTYLDESRGSPVPSWWADIVSLGQAVGSRERTGYPTQKPLALLERIIKAGSNKGDMVLDPFCGCATACVAAEKLGRQWAGADISQKARELIKARFEKEAPPGKAPHFTATPPQRDEGAN